MHRYLVVYSLSDGEHLQSPVSKIIVATCQLRLSHCCMSNPGCTRSTPRLPARSGGDCRDSQFRVLDFEVRNVQIHSAIREHQRMALRP